MPVPNTNVNNQGLANSIPSTSTTADDDARAKEAGLQKVTRTSDSAVCYRWQPDAIELVKAGGWTWNHWT